MKKNYRVYEGKKYEEKQLAPGVTACLLVMSGAAVVGGRRTPTICLAGRFWCGESPEDIAKDYSLGVEQVYDAIRYELRIRLSKRMGGLKPTRVRKARKS